MYMYVYVYHCNVCIRICEWKCIRMCMYVCMCECMCIANVILLYIILGTTNIKPYYIKYNYIIFMISRYLNEP